MHKRQSPKPITSAKSRSLKLQFRKRLWKTKPSDAGQWVKSARCNKSANSIQIRNDPQGLLYDYPPPINPSDQLLQGLNGKALSLTKSPGRLMLCLPVLCGTAPSFIFPRASMSSLAWDFLDSSRPRKRRTATPSQKMLAWDTLSHVCHICHKKIVRITDAELDHVRAYSKGGSTMKLSHRACNRSKSNKSLGSAQRHIGVRQTKRKQTKRSHRRRERGIWGGFPTW
jgi:hypothetical protein